MITFSFSGTSHGEGYSGIIKGIPQGTLVDVAYVNKVLSIRKKGVGRSSRQTNVDQVTFVGYEEQSEFVADGNDLTFFVANACVETRPNITAVRTGHADLVGQIRHPDMTARDVAEIASARSSLCYVVLGCICEQILKSWDIFVDYRVLQIGNVVANAEDDDFSHCDDLCCCDQVASAKMLEQIQLAKERGNSLGGIVQVRAKTPAGIGEIFPYHKHLDAQLASQLVGIPSVKGVSFGFGSQLANLTGVEAHDEVALVDGKIVYQTNKCGGIVGGVTTGQDIVVNLIVKPVPTVKGVQTVDTQALQVVPQHFERADSCVVPTVGLVAKHIVNYVLANQILTQYAENPTAFPKVK